MYPIPKTFFRDFLSVLARGLIPETLAAQIDREEYRQRLTVQICVLAGMPILLFYGIGDLFGVNPIRESAPEFTVASALLVTGWRMRRRDSVEMFLRFPMLAASALLMLNIHMGPGRGADLMWMYVMPLLAFAIFGRREGLGWTMALVAGSVALVVWPSLFGGYQYSSGYAVRYGISIVLVTAFSYAIESMRHIFYSELQTQKQALERALKDVKTLSGLVPICATCKKIRDDKGYWRQLETYIAAHTDAQFSHGICVSCLKKADRNVYNEMLNEGLIRESQDAEPPYRPVH
ncbi:MAG: hypothetical protein JXX14_11565 [Deltaproteobacteria bacterium]|nr:hypothetical protein [Deltaproteobacteria bacterium]